MPAAPVAAQQPAANTAQRINIVFILTDDLSWNLVQYMPHVQQMQRDGATFVNYFVTDSLCCPSRTSILTGRFPHNSGIYRNTGNDGGYQAFQAHGLEPTTFATALAAAGARAGMLGKYLNGYLPARHAPAAGWALWAVAGNGYRNFNYNLNLNGRIVPHRDAPEDYLTDVVSGLAQNFIRGTSGQPFLVEIATFSPHAPYVPAPRDANAFPDLRAPRTPAFNAAPDAGAVRWLAQHRALTPDDMAMIDRDFRRRAQSVLAVDAMIAALQQAVAAAGQSGNTYFVFSSDNGYHMGEHRLMPGKMTAFDEDIRVPLIVTGPGIPAGRVVEQIAENVDLAPTFLELMGAPPLATADGHSLAALLRGQSPADWRTLALVEHRGPVTDTSDPDMPAVRSGNPTTYEAIRARDWVYVEYADGEREYHDRTSDPNELQNSFAALPPARQAALHAMVQAAAGCRDAATCWAAQRPPGVTAAR
jgi:arylsulfatase A-like enzyme